MKLDPRGPRPAERTPERSKQGGRHLRWIGLGLWLALLAGIALIAIASGAHLLGSASLTAIALATIGVAGLVVFAMTSASPPELRTLRILAVLLPCLFIVCIEAVLAVLEADDLFSEPAEHILATAVLSLSAIPFALWIFRSFAALHDQLAYQAAQQEILYRASLDVVGESVLSRLQGAIVRGARSVVPSDRAILLVAAREGRPEKLVVDPPAPPSDDDDLVALRSAVGREPTTPVQDAGTAYLWARGRGAEPEYALRVERSHGATFTPQESLLLDMFAVAADAGINNAELLEEAGLVATVEERERIAHDLHDDLGQLLGFLTAKIQTTQEFVATGRPVEASRELADLERATRTLSDQVREAILGLRTVVGPNRPLAGALSDYTTEFGIQAGVATSFRGSPGAAESLPVHARFQVLRIAQEALSNARRHAHPRSIEVSLSEEDQMVRLQVHDDGVGFDTSAVAGSGRFGLKTMAERAKTLGGSLEVRSAPSEGTTVSATVPIDPPRER